MAWDILNLTVFSFTAQLLHLCKSNLHFIPPIIAVF